MEFYSSLFDCFGCCLVVLAAARPVEPPPPGLNTPVEANWNERRSALAGCAKLRCIKMPRNSGAYAPASRPKQPAVAELPLGRENDDWDDDGVELRPLVDARRSDGEPLQTASAQQRNAAIGYCCLMFLCCLCAQLATRFDPDKLRNAVPFIMHSCDGQGCERIVMLQV